MNQAVLEEGGSDTAKQKILPNTGGGRGICSKIRLPILHGIIVM